MVKSKPHFLLVFFLLLPFQWEALAQPDASEFQPFELVDGRDTRWADVRISFDDWEWLRKEYGDDINGYSLNGYGVQGLVLATRIINGLPAYTESMDPNSEINTCYIHFKKYDEAIETIKLASEMINDKRLIIEAIEVAQKEGFDEW